MLRDLVHSGQITAEEAELAALVPVAEDITASSGSARPLMSLLPAILALRDERWKLVYVADEDRFQLFDLRADPRETRDVFGAEGERFGDWQATLRAAAERAGAHALDVEGIDPATLEQMRAIGYFGR